MTTELSNRPSIDEIQDLVARAQEERSEYIAKLLNSAAAKLSAAFRSMFDVAASKLSPSH